MNVEQAGLKIVRLLAQKSFQVFFVGGIVRNTRLGLVSDNVDLATDATPNQIEQILSKQKIKVKPVGKKFGSILAIVDEVPVEITTFRSEGRYSDNRHPDQVEFIREYLADAKRRDFTINALYYDPIKKQLFDPTNGQKDLKAKILRFVGDPKRRIDEDALRMLRGVRLATQLGFKLEKNSFAAIKTRAKYIQGISGERIKAELDKILLSKNVILGMRLLQKSGLLRFLSSELDGLTKIFHHSKTYHLEGSVFEHSLLVLQALKLDHLALKYAALAHDVGKISTGKKVFKPEGWVYSFKGHEAKSVEIFEEFASNLKFSRIDKEIVMKVIELHDQKDKFFKASTQEQVTYAMQDYFDLIIDLWQADSVGNISKPENDWYRKPRFEAYKLGVVLLKKIKSKAGLIATLAKGDLIMKLSHLKPGFQLGQRIQDVKVQIVLDKIKNERDLKEYLEN